MSGAVDDRDHASGQRSHRILTVCGGTNTGSLREQNQDTFVIADLESGITSRPCIRTDVWVARPGVLMLVCDGMGGRAAGDIAAQLAATSIKNKLQAEGDNVGRAPAHSLKRAVLDANRIILDEARAHPDERGMGTTCTAVLVSPERLAIAQVGDSRAYLFRDGRLRALTRDQTLATNLVESGALKADQVEHFPYRHVLVQALGTNAKVNPVITDMDLREGDRVLLCSDGLHGPVSEESIGAIMARTRDVAEVSDALITAALAAGGPDNITVVVADCGPLTSKPPGRDLA
ncbi:MAG: protein phosphatase 2C domain-containing protein [Bacteroidota bacterium]